MKLKKMYVLFSKVIDPHQECKKRNSRSTCASERCCPRGMGFSTLASLINHSCDNNVGKFYTNDGKVVYFAIQPIQKDSQVRL